MDKTNFLADLINHDSTALYLARPRRFGKTLTVSTLEYLFSGNRELFKGLAIEKHLDEDGFAPRPVLRLDMSVIDTTGGLPEFREDLAKYTTERAKKLGVELPSDLSVVPALRQLIETLGSSSTNGIAVLIDEYDAPLVDYLDRPELLEELRKILRKYYQQLKGLDEHITFLFATGVSRNSNLGLFSTVNHITDVSIDPEFGAMLGFTHEELEKYFGPQLEESALSLRMTKARLLEEMKAYYNGFSFDAETLVYNPYSTLLFFSKKNKKFSNYWFTSATSKTLSDYMKDKRLTVEQFSGLTISRDFAEQPGPLDETDAKGYLYQSGYLTLRPGPDQEGDRGADDGWGAPSAASGLGPPLASTAEEPSPATGEFFTLDYPNWEVRSAMSKLVMRNILGGDDEAVVTGVRVREALGLGNVGALVEEFNNLLSRIDYVDYFKIPDQLSPEDPESPPGEKQYRLLLLSLVLNAGLVPFTEVHGSHGRADMVVPFRGRHWVIELKLSGPGTKDETRAKDGMSQIIGTAYAEGLTDPVLVTMAVNKVDKRVNSWVYRFGLDGRDEWGSRKPPKPPRSPGQDGQDG